MVSCAAYGARMRRAAAAEAPLPYQVTRSDDGTYEIRHRPSGEVVVLDDTRLSALALESAGEYLYALHLVDQANRVMGRSKMKLAIERGLRSTSASAAAHLPDVMVSVRWMLPDLAIPDEVLRVIVRRIAAESGVPLAD